MPSPHQRLHDGSTRSASTDSVVADLPPNHHAAYRPFNGLVGYLAGLTMIVGRGRDARLVADIAGLDDTDRLLDIGCGPGTAARMAARRGTTTIGVDPSAPMLRLARLLSRFDKRTRSVEWVEAGAEQLTLMDESATVCWSLASVHHWPELEPGLQEVHRVLKPDGRFVAIEKLAKPGASGLASHGWTSQQATRFGEMLTASSFIGVEVTTHELGRHTLVAVAGTKPSG